MPSFVANGSSLACTSRYSGGSGSANKVPPPVKDRKLTEAGVSQFRSRLNTEQYHSIYAEVDDRFRQVTTEPDFVAVLEAFHRKLGTVRQSRQLNYLVGSHTGQGSEVTLVHHTEFENDKGREQFTWHISDGQPLLVGYHINSNALVIR